MRKNESLRYSISRRLLGVTLVAALLAVASPSQAIDVGRGQAFQEQKFEAWGSSLAWFGNGIGSWTDAEARTDLLRIMFDQENGLGLNYARYNVGGGQNRLYARNMRPGALVQGWVPNEPSDIDDTSTWQWNWNADETQRRVLDEVLDFGVSRVDAISYSAPYWMTYSQDSAGNIDGAPNLPPENYDLLAHYQAEVVQHFYHNLGIQFQAFSPLNEPDVNWWVAGGRQEGMVVPDGQAQREVLTEVGQAFAARNLPIGLAGTEETNTPKAANSWVQLDSTTKDFITHLHTHTYGNDQPSSLNQVRNLAAADGKKLYMSEYGNNSTTGLLGGVALANRITLDVNELGANGWAYWQVIEPAVLTTTSPNAAWGLAWADYGQTDSGFVVRKQYHTMRQFTHAIRPGSTILDTTDDSTVAAYDPVGDTTVLVVSNLGNTADARSYDLLDGQAAFVRRIRTSTTEDFASLGRQSGGTNFQVDVPGESVTTLVLHHKPNLVQNAFLDTTGGPTQSLNGGWQASGAAEFVAESGPGESSLGSATIAATVAAGPGAIWQEGIGSSGTDLTGQAFQLSLDAQFRDSGILLYDAETTIGLEFYGADGQTLAHADGEDFSTELIAVTDDTQWRTFRTPTIVAPAGTRFVRPFVRVDNATASSTSDVRLDNFYLQDIRYVPRGRHWIASGNGSTSDHTNWDDDARREEHDSWYFGPDITQATTVVVDAGESVSLITFDSDTLYRIGGAGPMTFVDDANGMNGFDVRAGSHQVQTPLDLQADVVLQALDGAALRISGPVDANGHTVRIQGAGEIELSGAFALDGGVLEVFAEQVSGLAIGSQATLDGTLRVLLEPGATPSVGDAFELASYTGTVTEFNAIELPTLDAGLAWDVVYNSGSLNASIVELLLEGDFNNDGVVNTADYAVWRDNFGAPAGTLPNDPNSTPIGPEQYATWLANFGATLGSGAAVPEPSAVAAVSLAGIVGLVTRRGTRHASR